MDGEPGGAERRIREEQALVLDVVVLEVEVHGAWRSGPDDLHGVKPRTRDG
jgi:hypothetical protein